MVRLVELTAAGDRTVGHTKIGVGMSVGWLSALVFPFLTAFFGCGMLAGLERDRRLGLAAVASLAAIVSLVVFSLLLGPAEVRAALLRA